jgi:3-aminobutyryl-CoA ammonia-lyase
MSHVGLTVTQRRYVKYGDAHYGGNLVDGAYVLGLFGDVATEACIRMDGDEGLFASYSDVQFRAPVLAGDIIEATATVTAVGRRSRQLAFEARVVCRADPARGESAASVLSEPIVAVTAAGTVVVPAAEQGLPGRGLGSLSCPGHVPGGWSSHPVRVIESAPVPHVMALKARRSAADPHGSDQTEEKPMHPGRRCLR